MSDLYIIHNLAVLLKVNYLVRFLIWYVAFLLHVIAYCVCVCVYCISSGFTSKFCWGFNASHGWTHVLFNSILEMQNKSPSLLICVSVIFIFFHFPVEKTCFCFFQIYIWYLDFTNDVSLVIWIIHLFRKPIANVVTWWYRHPCINQIHSLCDVESVRIFYFSYIFLVHTLQKCLLLSWNASPFL